MQCVQYAAHNPKFEKMGLSSVVAINRFKDKHMVEGGTTLEKPPSPTYGFAARLLFSNSISTQDNDDFWHKSISLWIPNSWTLPLLTNYYGFAKYVWTQYDILEVKRYQAMSYGRSNFQIKSRAN